MVLKVTVCFLAAMATAWSPTAKPACIYQRNIQTTRVVTRYRVAPQPVALLGAGSVRQQGTALLARKTSTRAPVLQSTSLALKLIFSTLCSVFSFAARAYAADRLKAAPTSTTVATSFILSGDVLKWGGLAALAGTAYMFRREEVPILTETVVDETVSDDDPVAASAHSEVDGPDEVDMMSDLMKRMQQLAEERAAADAAEHAEDKLSDDSTDEWGTGNTAVLEPPKPDAPEQQEGGLLDDGPVVDFPVGFPLRDADALPELAPTSESEVRATQEQIEMLERMFGTRGDDA